MIFILNGILIGVIFDVFRILRRSFKTPNFITYIEDTLFWILSALIVMYSLFVFNNGQFRGYIFIGLFLGVAIYMLFFSKFIIKISVKIILLIKKFISIIFRILSYPIVILYKALRIIFIRANYKNLDKFIKYLYKI